ncbi:MAG: arylsulfatase [Bacteroidota bacterium]
MNRSPELLSRAFSLVISLTLVAGCSPRDEPSTPNIIFILADDLGYGDLSSFGQTNFSTPNIDRLADEGMRFTQHYSGATVCAPSRSALLTGMHTGHTAIRGNKEVKPEGQYPLADSVKTLSEMLQSEGYATGAFGKWGLGFPGSEGDPNRQGFDVFYGYNCQRLAHHYYPYYLWDNQRQDSLLANRGKQTGTYAPEVIHGRALQFMEANRDHPFFLFYPTAIPHAELAAPEEYMAKHRGKYLPEKAYEGTDEGEKYRLGPYSSQLETHAAFVAMIDLLDTQVGEILAKVEELGLKENTIIIFTSDNGPHKEGGADPEFFDSNGPLKGFKRDLYEGGIRVPMIVSWPGKIAAGSSSDHISAFWDFMPTFADLLQVGGGSDGLDGISMLPSWLSESGQQVHEHLYWEFHERGGRQAVRRGQWKAVRYDVFEDPDRTPELYDLSTDIGEAKNVAADYPEVTAEMARLMAESRTESPVFQFGDPTFLNVK